MIRTEKNEVINSIVNDFFVEDFFKDNDPIIAGGSILYLYYHFRDKNSLYSKRVISKAKSVKKLQTLNSLSPKPYSGDGTLGVMGYTGDIDVWLPNDEALNLVLAKSAFTKTPFSSTNWADSFHFQNDLFPRMSKIQVIKKVYENLESLINSFDIANCMIAWQDNTLYIDERLDKAFDSGMIHLVNNPFKEELTIGSKLFNILRYFKYSERYSLSFSQEMNQIALNLLLEIDDLDLKEYEEKIQISNSHYGVTTATSNTIRSMIQQFVRKIPHWYSMDSFREEDLTFLVSLNSDQLSSVTNFIKHALGSCDDQKVSFPF